MVTILFRHQYQSSLTPLIFNPPQSSSPAKILLETVGVRNLTPTYRAIGDSPRKNNNENALKLNQQLEKLIKQNPAQYMWLMRLYHTRPDGENAVY